MLLNVSVEEQRQVPALPHCALVVLKRLGKAGQPLQQQAGFSLQRWGQMRAGLLPNSTGRSSGGKPRRYRGAVCSCIMAGLLDTK